MWSVKSAIMSNTRIGLTTSYVKPPQLRDPLTATPLPSKEKDTDAGASWTSWNGAGWSLLGIWPFGSFWTFQSPLYCRKVVLVAWYTTEVGAPALDVDCQYMTMYASRACSPRGKRTGDVCTIKPKLTRGGSIGGHGHIVRSFRETILGVQCALSRLKGLRGTIDRDCIRAAGVAK